MTFKFQNELLLHDVVGLSYGTNLTQLVSRKKKKDLQDDKHTGTHGIISIMVKALERDLFEQSVQMR